MPSNSKESLQNGLGRGIDVLVELGRGIVVLVDRLKPIVKNPFQTATVRAFGDLCVRRVRTLR